MFILKEISLNKYRLLSFHEQLREEEAKTIEKTSFWKRLFFKKKANPKEEILKEIRKANEEIKTLKKAHNDTFYGIFSVFLDFL